MLLFYLLINKFSSSVINADGVVLIDLDIFINSMTSMFFSPISYLDTYDWGFFKISARFFCVNPCFLRWLISRSRINLCSGLCRNLFMGASMKPILGYPILGF